MISKIIITSRTDVNFIFIGNCYLQRTIKEDANQSICLDDSVDSRISTKSNKLSNLRCYSKIINGDFLRPTHRITGSQVNFTSLICSHYCTDQGRVEQRTNQGDSLRTGIICCNLLWVVITSDGEPHTGRVTTTGSDDD